MILCVSYAYGQCESSISAFTYGRSRTARDTRSQIADATTSSWTEAGGRGWQAVSFVCASNAFEDPEHKLSAAFTFTVRSGTASFEVYSDYINDLLVATLT